MIVEPRLTNRHAFRVIGSVTDGIGVTGLRFGAGIVRMYAGAEPDIVKGFGNASRLIRGRQLDANGNDTINPGFAGTHENTRQILSKLRVVEMGMAVDNHEPPCPAGSSM